MGKKPKMVVRYEKVKKDKPKVQVSVAATKVAKEKLPEIDYARLAKKQLALLSFAMSAKTALKLSKIKRALS